MKRRNGFTLVEMLVVIGIILLVIGLIGPMAMRAWKAGDRARTTADLSAIAAGLEAYRTDHGDYPRVDALPFEGASATQRGFNGARMLCRALIGPGPAVPQKPPGYEEVFDGSDGPGFRTRGLQGRVYSPYVNVSGLKLGNPESTAPNQPIGLWAILDGYGKPILYYPATGKPNIRLANAYVGDYDQAAPPAAGKPAFNARDNSKAMPLVMLSKMLGDTNGDQKFTDPESPATEAPFLLWSSGPDETFGTTTTADKSDDITNFRN